MLNSLISGFCGSLGSLMGKLAFNPDLPFHGIVRSHVCQLIQQFSMQIEIEGKCQNNWGSYLVFIFRIILFALMVLSNTIMISTFLKALERNVIMLLYVIY
jgi:hypothetical protein